MFNRFPLQAILCVSVETLMMNNRHDQALPLEFQDKLRGRCQGTESDRDSWNLGRLPFARAASLSRLRPRYPYSHTSLRCGLAGHWVGGNRPEDFLALAE
jgi:hypothetical protein